MTDVTRILSIIEHDDPSAAERLLPLVIRRGLRQLMRYWPPLRPESGGSAPEFR